MVVYAIYMALEPDVRRRWPETLIAWSRVLAGRLKDPLVGRDLLLGILVGVVHRLLTQLSQRAPAWLGEAPRVSVPFPGFDGSLLDTVSAILGSSAVAVLIATTSGADLLPAVPRAAAADAGDGRVRRVVDPRRDLSGRLVAGARASCWPASSSRR